MFVILWESFARSPPLQCCKVDHILSLRSSLGIIYLTCFACPKLCYEHFSFPFDICSYVCFLPMVLRYIIFFDIIVFFCTHFVLTIYATSEFFLHGLFYSNIIIQPSMHTNIQYFHPLNIFFLIHLFFLLYNLSSMFNFGQDDFPYFGFSFISIITESLLRPLKGIYPFLLVGSNRGSVF